MQRTVAIGSKHISNPAVDELVISAREVVTKVQKIDVCGREVCSGTLR